MKDEKYILNQDFENKIKKLPKILQIILNTDGTVTDILSKWSGQAREKISGKIQKIKDINEWPDSRSSVSNFGQKPKVIALLNTDKGSVLYYGRENFNLGSQLQTKPDKLLRLTAGVTPIGSSS